MLKNAWFPGEQVNTSTGCPKSNVVCRHCYAGVLSKKRVQVIKFCAYYGNCEGSKK